MKTKLKLQWKPLLLCIALPLAVGGISALLTHGAMADFQALRQPPLSPPGWLFPAVWTALYTLMGVSSFLVLVSGAPQEQVHTALFFYGAQLLLNFVWPLLFFLAKAYLFAFFWLLALFVLVAVTLVRFGRIQKAAGWLLLPYLVWTAFALYLNLGIYLLN